MPDTCFAWLHLTTCIPDHGAGLPLAESAPPFLRPGALYDRCGPCDAVLAIRQRGLRRAIEHLRSVDTALVTVAELCAAAHVTQRTLEYAFRETFGLSPSGFVQSRRYHAARRDLLAADGKTATVQAIAQCNGFYQMGRFALRYRERFGESPSETLMKPPTDGVRSMRAAVVGSFGSELTRIPVARVGRGTASIVGTGRFSPHSRRDD